MKKTRRLAWESWNSKFETVEDILEDEEISGVEPEEKNIIQKYNIYNNRIILLNENNIVKDAFKNPNDSELDLIDKNETVFYALVL